MVGPFFYIDCPKLNYKGLLMHRVNEEKAERAGDFLNSPIGHDQLFDNRFGNESKFIEYFDYPRGRVVYNTATKKHVLYIDRCIRSMAAEIAREFDIIDYDVQGEEHYVCLGCMEELDF